MERFKNLSFQTYQGFLHFVGAYSTVVTAPLPDTEQTAHIPPEGSICFPEIFPNSLFLVEAHNEGKRLATLGPWLMLSGREPLCPGHIFVDLSGT
uniref:Uncharacterized protein n=1 Tax=Anguilla anguilla TaxID=7936 RepID=A0A0E9X362_ANGAN